MTSVKQKARGGLPARAVVQALRVIVTLLPFTAAAADVFAQGAYTFSYQGRLTEDNGKPIDGPVALQVSFFRTASGGSPLLTITDGLRTVPLQEGIFQIELTLAPGDYQTVFSDVDDPVYVQITDLTHAPDRSYDRQKISMIPYAAKVPVDNKTITFDGSGRATLMVSGTAATGKVIGADANGGLSWVIPATDNAASTATPSAIVKRDSNGGFVTDNILVTPSSAGRQGLVVKGAAAQTANLQEWQDTSGTVLSAIGSDGSIKLKQSGAGSHQLVLKAAAGMSANATYIFPAAPDNGKFLSTDASGNLSWATPAGGGASLTQGSIPFADSSGNLTEDNGRVFWDATAHRLGIGTNLPTSTLQVAGSIATAVAAKTAAYSLTASDSIITADATTLAFAVTLPTATGVTGRRYTVKKTDASAHAVTLTPFGVETIDGAATYVLSKQNDAVSVVSDGASWFVDTATGSAASLTAHGTSGDIATNSAGTSLTFSNSGANSIVATHASGSLSLGVNGATAALQIKAGNTKTSLNIEGDKVAIGTTAAAGSSLEVRGAGSSSATSSLNVTNAGGVSSLFVRDDGRIGVGTTSPRGTVDIRNDLWLGTPGSIHGIIDSDDGIFFNAGASGGTGDNSFHFGKGRTGGAGGTEYMVIDSTGKVGIGDLLPTHALTLPAASSGIALYNTSDEATNYERGTLSWNANSLVLQTAKGGTGSARNARVLSPDGSGITVSNFGQVSINGNSTGQSYFSTYDDAIGLSLTGKINSQTSVPVVSVGNSSFGSHLSAASGSQTLLQVADTVNQSGSAGYTGLLVNMTEAATGSGSKNLADFQSGGASRLVVSSGGKVGIGTTNPASTLDVMGQGSFSSTATTDGSGRIVLQLLDKTSAAAGVGPGLQFSGNYNGTSAQAGFANISGIKENGTGGDYAGALAFSTRINGSPPAERVRISGAGNVGIGTQAPSSRLHVVDPITTVGTPKTVLTLATQNSQVGAGPEIAFQYGGAADLFLAKIRADGGPGGYGGSLRFFTEPPGGNGLDRLVERLTLLDDGKVGVGVSSPQTLLHVGDSSGTIRIGSNTGSITSLGSLQWVNTQSGTWEVGRIEVDSDPLCGANCGDMVFLTGQAAATASGRMIIKSGGNVGIGSTSPAYALDVAGTVRASNFIGTGGASGSAQFGISAAASGAASSAFGDSATASDDRATAVGNAAVASGFRSTAVGAQATASATYTTALGRNAQATGSYAVALGQGAVASTTGSIAIGYAASSAYVNSIALGLNSATTADHQFVSGSGAGGNNYSITDVYFGKGVSDAAPSAYTFHGTGGNASGIAGGGIAIAGGLGGAAADAGGGILFQTAAAGTGTTLSERMRIAPSGNIGIGTTNPARLLEVAGGNVRLTTDYGLEWGGGTDLIYGSAASHYLRLRTNGTERLAVDSTGKVGIGTTNPASQLTVVADTLHEGSLQLGNSTSTSGDWRFIVGSPGSYDNYLKLGRGAFSNNFDIAWASTGDTVVGAGRNLMLQGSAALEALENGNYGISFQGATFTGIYSGTYTSFMVNNGSEAMRLAANGSVGIGTNTPASGYKLDTAGSVRVGGGLCVKNGACTASPTDGSIYATNTTVQSADLAEHMPVTTAGLEAGDVVALASSADGQGVFSPSETAYQASAVGVVSTKPGVALGSDTKDSRPVALAGRVPVNVTLEGGPIAVGDYLVPSSTPGKAMRAKDPRRGGILGVALSAYNGTPVAPKIYDDGIAHEAGHQVMMLVRPVAVSEAAMTELQKAVNAVRTEKDREIALLKAKAAKLETYLCRQDPNAGFCDGQGEKAP